MIAGRNGNPMPSVLTLQSLPLFPLGTVLFPGGVLPLRIFEVRYLDMIGRCHRAGAPFGVVSLTQGDEVRRPGAEREAFAQVGTIASISALEQPRPGLMVVRAIGQQRFRIRDSEQLKHGLWIANVEQIGPDQSVPVPDDLQPTATALANLIQRVREKGDDAEPLPIQEPLRLDDCAWVANRWCELLPMPVQL